jgi:hypothetical protein
MCSSMCPRILMRASTANLGLCGSSSVWRQRAYQFGRGFHSSEEQKHQGVLPTSTVCLPDTPKKLLRDVRRTLCLNENL